MTSGDRRPGLLGVGQVAFMLKEVPGPPHPPGPGGKGSVGRAQVCKGWMSGG